MRNALLVVLAALVLAVPVVVWGQEGDRDGQGGHPEDEQRDAATNRRFQASFLRARLAAGHRASVRASGARDAAAPDAPLVELLATLARRAEVVVISGRGRDVLERWLGHLDVGLVAGHGVWSRQRAARDAEGTTPGWQVREALQNSWKEAIRPVLQMHTVRTPGSQVEEKAYSLAWHYRRAEPELAAIRLSELKEALLELTAPLDVMLLEGERVLEIKSTAVSKGYAAAAWLARAQWDFVLAVGDDRTDEDMFEALPPAAWSIKLGTSLSAARYFLSGPREVRELLGEITAARMA